MKTIYLIVLNLFLFEGCNNTATNHYTTRSKAEAEKLFERGWLPNIIPASARNITVSNDLDRNRSEGEFQYDPKETDDFSRYLKPYAGQKLPLSRWQAYINEQKKKGYVAFEYSSDKSVWVFLVNIQTGHVRYVMWLS